MFKTIFLYHKYFSEYLLESKISVFLESSGVYAISVENNGLVEQVSSEDFENFSYRWDRYLD